MRLPTWAIHGPQADLGRFFTSALAHGTGEGIFFNPSLKFAPPGSRTQDLRRCYSQSQELTQVSTNVDAYSHPAYGDTLVVSFSVPSSVAYPVCYTCLTRNSLPPTNRIWNFGYLLHSTCRSSQVAESAGNPIQLTGTQGIVSFPFKPFSLWIGGE